MHISICGLFHNLIFKTYKCILEHTRVIKLLIQPTSAIPIQNGVKFPLRLKCHHPTTHGGTIVTGFQPREAKTIIEVNAPQCVKAILKRGRARV